MYTSYNNHAQQTQIGKPKQPLKKPLGTKTQEGILQQDAYLVNSEKGTDNPTGPTLRIKPNTIYNESKVHPTTLTPTLELHTKDTHYLYTSIHTNKTTPGLNNGPFPFLGFPWGPPLT